MINEVEISQLNCRFEHCRLKAPGAEKNLLYSISIHGIRDPLQVVEKGEERILLDGFKRYRCAHKLGLQLVPCHSLDEDEALGIIKLLRIANAKSLSILEQAKLIDELMTVHKMCNAEIADMLEKSKAWVSVRTGIIKEMSSSVMEHIFKGHFPVYSYMYTLRQFMRLNSIQKNDIDQFVNAVAGHKLSTRDIDILANGFFKGSDEVRDQIIHGDFKWSLDLYKQSKSKHSQCSKREQAMLNWLEINSKYMQKFLGLPWDTRFKSPAFMAQANLLSGGILRKQEAFFKAMKEFYDRTQQTNNDPHSAS